MNQQRTTIALFGASGATGRQVVEQARIRGVSINALVRRQSNDIHLEGMFVKTGDFNDAEAMDAIIANCRAVICVIGPRPPYREIFCASATQAIIESMLRVGVKRLICQTGAMIGEYKHNRSVIFRWLTRSVHRTYPAMSEDRARQEELIKQSDLEWTIVKPSRLTKGGLTGRVNAAVDLKLGMLSKISRADLACFLLDLVESNEFSRQAVFVK